MSWSQRRNSVWTVACKTTQRTGVETGLHLSCYGAELFIAELLLANDPFEMVFGRLDSSLPQASKVRCSLGNGVPANSVAEQEGVH